MNSGIEWNFGRIQRMIPRCVDQSEASQAYRFPFFARISTLLSTGVFPASYIFELSFVSVVGMLVSDHQWQGVPNEREFRMEVDVASICSIVESLLP